MSWWRQDFLYALRFLKKQWGVTSVAVLVLGLGISLTASMFAIINGVVLSGPAYDDVEEIISFRTTIPQSQFEQPVRFLDYLDWREQQDVFDEMAAYYTTSVTLSSTEDRAQSYGGVRLTASTFALLGKQALLGRTFTAQEDLVANETIIILGHHVWENRYDRDPDIVGKTIRVNARPHTVVGVMPPDFRFPELHDVWLPLGVDPTTLEARREGPGLRVLGRLADGATQTAAETQITTIARRLEQQYPETNEDILPVAELWIDTLFIDDETRGILYTMFTAVMGVLLIACANVANLLFASTIARGKELAIRTALGATRNRVLRQLLSETFLLAVGGAVLGLVLSKFSLDLFTRIVAPMGIPPWMVFALSPSVFVFVLGATFFAAFASGILPALHATKVDVNSILKDQVRGSTHGSKWSTGLVVLEVAVSCALLVGAGLTVRSTLEMGEANHGVNIENILTARIGLPGATYPDSTSRLAFTDRLHRELETVPGVRRVGISSNLPVLGTQLYFYGVRDGEYADDSEYPFGGLTRVSLDFFDLIDVPIVSGRGFRATDDLGSQRVVIVDQRFAERNWPGGEALGKQVRLGRSDSENAWLTVAGVVRTFEMTGPLSFAASRPEGMFVPLAQEPVGGLAVMLRTRGDPFDAAAALREVVAGLDPDVPVAQVNTLEGRVNEENLDEKILTGMFMVFGIAALVLASLGLYAVMAFSVSRRTSEVGIRMALGADGGRIVRLVLHQGARPVGIGIAVGLGLAVLLGKALSTVLFQVSATDPLTFTAIPLLLAVVSMVAIWVPANRAARVEPVIALRAE